MPRVGVLIAIVVATWSSPRVVPAGELRLQGLAWARGIETEGQPSWMEGGFGRLTDGASAPGTSVGVARFQAQLGLEWKPTETLLVHAHGLARKEGRRDGGERFGLTEAFVQYRPDLSAAVSLRVRGGTFFPQTSRENVGPLWSSPYTLTLSALNTWIGEEMRLTGLESVVVVRSPGGSELQLAATAFAANDTLGTLVAWRGWSFSDRLTVVGETVPLPPLTSFRPGREFSRQQPGTRPIDEIDDRVGWQARARWSRRDVVLLQAAYTDNGGDRELYHRQYSWRTRFGQVAAELHVTPSLVLLGEAALGDTGMGPADSGHVDVRFHVAYLMASWGGARARLSARYDRFYNQDRDGTAEPDDESGSAWTLAALWRPEPHVRLGVEALQVHARRPAAAFSGANPDTDARRLQGEVRLTF